MEPKADQDSIRLGISTHLSLLKRQVHEWKTLLERHKLARQTMMEEPANTNIYAQRADKLKNRSEQLTKLVGLMIYQSEERYQLRLRHQREATELDQVLGTH